MKVQQLNMVFMSKRTLSIVPKFTGSQSKASQSRKQNEFGQIGSTKKYIAKGQKQKQQHEPDETQKFLQQTKNRLDVSTRQLNQFYKKKLMHKSTKQDVDYSILSKQIKATKQRLKHKHQQKQPSTCMKQTNSPSFINNSSSITQNKFNLLQKVISSEQLTLFQQQLANKQKQIISQYKDNADMQQKLIQYFNNYQIISRFLQQVAKDTQKLQIKQNNIQLYYRMKDQMISLLSNQEFFLTHIRAIENSQEKRDKTLLTRTIYQQEKFTKTFTRPKHNTPVTESSLVDKIQQLLETSKSNIKQAFSKFNRPDLMYEIELQFNRRLNQSNTNN